MTIYATWPRWAARVALLTVVALVALAFAVRAPVHGKAAASDMSDIKLYRAITADVQAGRPYYSAAALEQRANGYPTAPAPVIREPTLATLLALLPTDAVRAAVLVSLGTAVVLCFQTTLVRDGVALKWRLAAVASLMTGVSIVGTADASYVHEVWAAMFMALSLILYRPDRWLGSVILAFVACVFRELAFPFVLAMGACALWERRKREFFGWMVCSLIFFAAYTAHIYFASLEHRAGDHNSQGWIYASGLDFIISTARWNLLLHGTPGPVIIFGASAALLGLLGSPNLRARRSALVAGGYMSAFAVAGRPDNYLWGILYAPFLSVGFVLAPAALRDLFRRAFGPAPIRSLEPSA